MTVPKPVGGVEAFDFAVDAGEVARLANIPRHRGMGHFDEAGGDGELLFGAQVFKGAEGFISPLLWRKVLHNVVGLVEFFLAVTVGVLTLLEPLRFQLGLGVLVGGAQAQVVLLIALGPLAKEFFDVLLREVQHLEHPFRIRFVQLRERRHPIPGQLCIGGEVIAGRQLAATGG